VPNRWTLCCWVPNTSKPISRNLRLTDECTQYYQTYQTQFATHWWVHPLLQKTHQLQFATHWSVHPILPNLSGAICDSLMSAPNTTKPIRCNLCLTDECTQYYQTYQSQFATQWWVHPVLPNPLAAICNSLMSALITTKPIHHNLCLTDECTQYYQTNQLQFATHWWVHPIFPNPSVAICNSMMSAPNTTKLISRNLQLTDECTQYFQSHQSQFATHWWVHPILPNPSVTICDSLMNAPNITKPIHRNLCLTDECTKYHQIYQSQFMTHWWVYPILPNPSVAVCNSLISAPSTTKPISRNLQLTDECTQFYQTHQSQFATY